MTKLALIIHSNGKGDMYVEDNLTNLETESNEYWQETWRRFHGFMVLCNQEVSIHAKALMYISYILGFS